MAKVLNFGCLPCVIGGLLMLNRAVAVDVAAVPAARAALPQGSVWECVLNGQRTFSDAPCGAHPVVRQLKPLNTMESSPAFFFDDAAPAAAASDQSPADSTDGSTASSEVYWIHERARRAHPPAHGSRGHERSRKH
jgi:hypothetical protein